MFGEHKFLLYQSMVYVAFQFLGVLEKELAKFEKNKDDFLSDFTQVIQQKPP